jgi:hypothetical protein
MRTVWDVSTRHNSFPQRLGQTRFSVPIKVEVVRAIDQMLDGLLREPRTQTVERGTLIWSFNTLLQEAKEQFRGSATLRLIEPLGFDASAALVVVRLSVVKRTLDAELARAA